MSLPDNATCRTLWHGLYGENGITAYYFQTRLAIAQLSSPQTLPAIPHIYILIEAQRTSGKGLGCVSKNFNYKCCRLVPTTVVHTHIYGNMNHVDFCLQGSGDLRMGSSQQTDQILLFLADFLCFIRHLVWISCGMFVCGGACAPINRLL